jgi:hypothetical protein
MATEHTFTIGNNEPVTKKLSFGKAIRAKCLECSNGSSNEVKHCPIELCPLYPFRFGKDPGRVKREISDEQREAAAKRFAKYRQK